MTTLTLIDLAAILRAEREQEQLRDQIVADCGGQVNEFLAAVRIAATEGGALNAASVEPPTVSEATDAVFGNLLDPAWYCEMVARAAEHADWLDWNRTQEDARP